MPAHGARTRTGRIQKDRIEQGALARNIDVCKRRIKITAITRRKFDSQKDLQQHDARAAHIDSHGTP